eukprot:gb/GEZN01003504.1/.p1 GENE.gb/GEZN01003504.1/~~gb/GEZN01003504.1/.p1  ORF type:complete len:663 (+),score=98.85 gb/GEZN01003504.1/:174-1991(+)
MDKATRFVANTLEELIACHAGVLLVFDRTTKPSQAVRTLLEAARDDDTQACKDAPTSVCLNNDWLHTLPSCQVPVVPPANKRLFILVGTPAKPMFTTIRSTTDACFTASYANNRAIVLAKGVCMLPLGTQQHNVFGVDEVVVLDGIIKALHNKGLISWGLPAGSKKDILDKAFDRYEAKNIALPAPRAWSGSSWGLLVSWTKYINQVKLARPRIPVINYYDSGLSTIIMMMTLAEQKVSLLTDADGLRMIKEGSIGHVVSKLNHLATVHPLKSTPAVYNFWLGDGAARLNGCMELSLHHMQNYSGKSLMTVFIFNNQNWAIEDSLVSHEVEEHKLFNKQYYDLLAAHPKVRLCNTEAELKAFLLELSSKTNDFLAGNAEPEMQIVVLRCFNATLPPVLGDTSVLRSSVDMAFMCDVLGHFAVGCQHKVPLYGCSHFESIQYLDIFFQERPEGKKYQYICGKTDIQASHMAGYIQPEGKCVLFINDLFGVHSLGETLKMVLSGFGGRQLLIFIWHPQLLAPDGNFEYHRQPMVWPSPGPTFMSFFARTAKDVYFHEFDGRPDCNLKVKEAIGKGTPLVVVNMLPIQERGYLQLDTRVAISAPPSKL